MTDLDKRPETLNLVNWRQAPNAQWAFHHVREIIPAELIVASSRKARLETGTETGFDNLDIQGTDGNSWSLQDWRDVSSSDALLVAHRGQLVHEWYRQPAIESHPHIVFSVSKSITAVLAGALVGQGKLDPAKAVIDYIPELSQSGYADASVQQVLDMQVQIDFDENYLATSGKFVEYRTATGWHPCAVDQIDNGLHEFLCSVGRIDGAHGEVWQYKSPNSDLLGWILERAGGESLTKMMSEQLWQPMGAEGDAYITVDRKGAPRTAGGICVLPRDLLRFGELVRNLGFANEQQIIPQSWIEDCSDGGSREAWERGESAKEFPAGQYRNKWYQTGNDHRAMLAIGIHSQWIYIDPVAEVTIIKLSSQDAPLRPDLDAVNLTAFEAICAAV